MTHINLGNPCPRPRPLSYTAFRYESSGHTYLPAITKKHKTSILKIFDERRSHREFSPLTENQLSEFLWYTAKTRQRQIVNGLKWEHRPTPSAGGLHPVDIFLFSRAGQKNIQLYNPLSHALTKLRLADESVLAPFDREIELVVPGRQGCTLIFGAQFGLTNAKYKNPDSLVWRDVGAIIGVMSLVAEAFGLNACPLGITCEPWLSKALGSKGQIVGVGGLLIGSRS